MDSKHDLARIGFEGFAIVEEFLDKKAKNGAPKKPYYPQRPTFSHNCMHQYQPTKAPLYQVPASENTHGVVQFRGGVTVMDYSKRKSAPMFY